MDFSALDDSRGAMNPTADFLQREKQIAGQLFGDDAALFGHSGQGAAPPAADADDLERRARAFPALDDEAGLTPAAEPKAPVSEEARFQASFPALDEPAADDQHGWDSWDDNLASSEAPTAPQPDVVEASPEPAWEPASEDVAPAPAPEPEPEPTPAHTHAKTPFTYEDMEDETEPLRRWREQQDEEIARREAQSERERAEAVSRAEQEIDQFYADYNAQKEKNIKKNKEAEARFLEQKQQDLAEGTTWTRITKLLDLQNSKSKTIAKGGAGASDLSHMKELYLSLRREGDKAPGAAGY